MSLKIYKKYIISSFIIILLKTTFIFFTLIYTLNIFDEINYFKDLNLSFAYPFFLTFLNAPAALFELFPFIFLITTQFFFIKMIDKNELSIFKNYGLTNLRIIKLLAITSFFLGFFIIIIFYNFSAKLKYNYLDLKNYYSDDNKYLAVITKNGLWIKDEIDGVINIINAEKIENNYLINTSIVQFTNNYDFIKNISAKKIDITKSNWTLFDISIFVNNLQVTQKDTINFQTNFNIEKINSIFSNLFSLTLLELYDLKKDYIRLNIAINEIELHNYRIYSYPFYLVILTILSSIIMLNIKQNGSKIFYLILGILVSVCIYYISFFFNLLGNNEKIPLIIAICMPLIILAISCVIGLIRINEK